jgi:phosphoadenosine phosphosulfate reductase
MTTIDGTTPLLDELDLEWVDRSFGEHRDPARMIRWLGETVADAGHGLDGIIVASAMANTALVHLVSSVLPGIEVLFIDTGYHFEDTLATARRVSREYPIRLHVTPAPPIGEPQYRDDPDGCCHLRKVVPLEQALQGRVAWISGVRRSEAATRAEAPFLARDRRGLLKLNPIAAWTDDDLAAYVAANEVILNPLLSQGYPSIGCWPCTRRPEIGEDARAGRWAGREKTECGLHL